jgi:uncharacterized protein YdeI (YjbR/CyaY-like superfamily)
MQKRFQARLEKVEISLPWVVARLPFDPVQAWPNHIKLHVKATIRAAGAASEPYSFSTSLQCSQEHGYFLLVTQKIRKAARLSVGDLAEIVLEADLEGRAATPPPELAKLLRADRSVKKWFEALNYSTRKYIAENVAEPKSPQARLRRAEQWIERFLLTMEGEASPPPILQAAFRRQPLARAGWDALTANQRRLALLSLFMCQSPEAQAKRVERAIAQAMKGAMKASRRITQTRRKSIPEE